MGSFTQKLKTACGPHVVRVRVFGSRARGDARPDSDLDVLVLIDCDETSTRETIYHAAAEVGYEMDLSFVITPLCMTIDHFDGLRQRERKIAHDIVAEGVDF